MNEPMANGGILRRTKHMPTLDRVPTQPVAFLALAFEPQVRPRDAIGARLARMLRPVKHVHIPTDRLCRQQIRVLGHVPSPVDLAIVVDRLNGGHSSGRTRVRTHLPPVLVVLCQTSRVGRRGVGDLDLGDDQLILGLAGGVRAEKKSVEGIVCVWGAGAQEV